MTMTTTTTMMMMIDNDENTENDIDDDKINENHNFLKSNFTFFTFSVFFIAGRGFQFAPVVGKLLAELVTKQKPSYDLEPFSLKRFSAKYSEK